MDNFSSKSGLLAGTTVLRFAHAFDTGGGTERYLDDLDRALLERNAMTIVRLHLTRDPSRKVPTEESIGQGKLVLVPLLIVPGKSSHEIPEHHTFRSRLKQMVRDRVLYNRLVWCAGGARWAMSRQLPSQPGQAIGAGQAAAEMLRIRRIDLIMLHFFGGSDADEIVVEARKARVPFAVLNHYSNDRFLHFAIRKHAMLANGVAGVNGLGLPCYIRSTFTNLSDGIDTDFFCRAHARPLANPPPGPIILLPARIVREKGQLDLLRAATLLRQSGIECYLAFAGRIDASDFVAELQSEIERAGMMANVRFLGGLGLEDLRDWYAASTVVAFPTYHHEGLGRVIVEAQAMNVPVVAYATGGVAEGIESGKTGYLVRTGDITGLSRRLAELLTSPTTRAEMGANGRQKAEHRFSLAALADRHEQFYLRVVSEFKAGRANTSS